MVLRYVLIQLTSLFFYIGSLLFIELPLFLEKNSAALENRACRMVKISPKKQCHIGFFGDILLFQILINCGLIEEKNSFIATSYKYILSKLQKQYVNTIAKLISKLYLLLSLSLPEGRPVRVNQIKLITNVYYSCAGMSFLASSPVL